MTGLKIFASSLIILLCSCGKGDGNPLDFTLEGEKPVPIKEEERCPHNLFDRAVEGTIVCSDLLDAIAWTESQYSWDAVSPDGLDEGMFQLRKTFHEERAAKWGDFDPFDAEQSARIAALILQELYDQFNDWTLALEAYNRGPTAVKNNPTTTPYSTKVLRIFALRTLNKRSKDYE